MDEEIRLLKELNCPEWVIEHSKGVSRKACEIASNFDDVDMELVRVGGLLHDVGRSKTNSIEHAVIGAQILKERGYPQEIINIVERHIGTGLTEEDARQLEFTIEKWKRKLGENHPSIEKIKKIHEELVLRFE